MSAFLGPIHHVMYAKILLQDRISEALLSHAEQQGWTTDLRAAVDAAAPAAPDRPLEEIINASNIHGWLARAVSGCETRLAAIAATILDGHPECLEPLTAAVYALGAAQTLPAQADAPAVFDAMTAVLLDGMPCDRPLQVQDSAADRVIWTVGTCPHAPYWENSSVGTGIYYTLRTALLSGMLQGTGYSYAQSANGTFTLKKEDAA